MIRKILRGLALLLAFVLLGVAIFVAATWAPDRPVAELKPRWAPPPSTFIELAGMSVHVRDEGPRDDPRPIVLLHGTSASLHTWQGWTNALRAKHRVIRLDLPGFGLTGPTPDDHYEADVYTKFMSAFFDKMAIAHCTLGGNSLGGAVAWRTAVVDPRVERLILVDAGGYPNPHAKMPLGFKLAKTPVLNKLARYVLPRSLVEKSVRNVYGDPSKVSPELIDLYYDLAVREGNRVALVKRFEQWKHGDDVDKIKALHIPTLILWGGRDTLIPPEHAERFHADIAGSQLVVFENLGHVPQEEDPAATVAPVLTFLP